MGAEGRGDSRIGKRAGRHAGTGAQSEELGRSRSVARRDRRRRMGNGRPCRGLHTEAARVVAEFAVKVATRRNGTRDGEVVVVSRDLTRCVAVPEIARTLQAALDEWNSASP